MNKYLTVIVFYNRSDVTDVKKHDEILGAPYSVLHSFKVMQASLDMNK